MLLLPSPPSIVRHRRRQSLEPSWLMLGFGLVEAVAAAAAEAAAAPQAADEASLRPLAGALFLSLTPNGVLSD